jgi:hypothetical protein
MAIVDALPPDFRAVGPACRVAAASGRRHRGRRSIGTMVGDDPAWMLPRTSNPYRSYNGTLRRFDASR